MGLFVLLTLVLAIGGARAFPPVNPDYKYASSEAVEAWHDLKFGLRIHWGEYAITGLGPESWPLNRNKNKTFDAWYWNQYKTWNPSNYNATSWISLMNTAGIKFFDFTTKHHEGFSMYDTNTLVHNCWDLSKTPAAVVDCDPPHPYSSMEAFGRDVVDELITAARQGGVKPGLYFSHIDWYDPDMRIDQWNAVATNFCPKGSGCDPSMYNQTSNPTEWQRFVLRHRAQIAEVLTKYGEIVELSLDMEFPDSFDQDMVDTIMLARELAPNTLFRGRGIGGTAQKGGYGDYTTPEEQFPDSPLPGNWQVIYHGSDYMSYDPDPTHYVNGSFIIWHLVDIVAKGGLMQIGYGPDGEGEFHPKAVEALEYAGRWMQANGESIYSTRPLSKRWSDIVTAEMRLTRSKDNTTIYATYLDYGGDKFWGSMSHTIGCVKANANSTITLLGYQDPFTRKPISLNYTVDKTTFATTVDVPPATIRDSLLGPGFAFKIQGSINPDC
eukprot:m.117835 g.117835  ORF g.117835 m.117835 type:complete len:495 (+) comp14261_c0_seq8:149-1633(+)